MRTPIRCLIAVGLVVLSAIAGCATIGATQYDQASGRSWPDEASSPSLFPTQAPDTSPRLILPAGGGSPVMAIPLGGGVYLPLNADPVTVGIPLSP
jgi:hypothetical protein